MRFTSNGFELAATDLSNHLACKHLTQLSRKVALDELKRPYRNDPALEVLIQRGQQHEAAYVEHLKNKGLTVTDVRGKSVDATVKAMRDGVDVITQANLSRDGWVGYADILIKTNRPGELGDWSYEVQDTKLAVQTRTATILQLCVYSDLLTALQGATPEKMYVVKPGDDFPTEEFLFNDFQAYYRLVRKNFLDIMGGPALETYPEPVPQCDICWWWKQCDTRRRDDDHLSLVAGIRTLHIEELRRQNIDTLTTLANAREIQKPARGNLETFKGKKWQAKVQLDGRLQDRLVKDYLPVENGRGFNRLPEPNPGDIYFDIEGDAFYPEGGLEYLLGYAYREDAGTLVYNKFWSTNRVEESRAFKSFMQFVIDRWKKFPDLYIYHFAPYEPSAIKRLARVHAAFESDVDELLRSERFIDLHRTFKEAMLASVERYSLKDLERFTTYTRQIELHDASVARKSVECALELNEFPSLPAETVRTVEQYNKDDCLATQELHVWMEGLRAERASEFQRPVPDDSKPTEEIRQMEIRSKAIFDSLVRNLPEDRREWDEEQKAKWLLANQIDYFRREDKSAWWDYFRVHELDHEELLDERKAITGLQFSEPLPLKPRERTPTHRYTFPPQELSIDEGDDLVEVKGEKIGKVVAISLEHYTVDIKKSGKSVDRHPSAVHVFDRIDPGTLATSLMNLANEIDENELAHQWDYRASKDLLMRRKPLLLEGSRGAMQNVGEDTVAAAIRIALNLDRSILPIQGPPGTGKTYTGAQMIIALSKQKKRIGITAISHSVIRTLCEKVQGLCTEMDHTISFVHKVSETSDACPEWVTEETDGKKALDVLNDGKVVAGTAWLWADDKAAGVLDYLFIDEAGQMSLSQALAASRAAKNIILLGDPQQLEQPQRGAHPEGSDVAALTYLLEGYQTMPEGKGLFLGITRRMHPNIALFTSEIFYEGRLEPLPGLERQIITGSTRFDGAGLFFVPVDHKGNQNRSPEEIESIGKIVQELLAKGSWTNINGETKKLTPEDILVVAPYNAQVAALIEALPELRIGTVDKFQGKEAPVVIYSMTSSSAEDAPRGMNFLFNPNRFNVATSRARCICILVASPKLIEADCHSIEQMKWANALCRYVEMAKLVEN